MKTGLYSRLAWNNIIKNKQVYLPYILTATGIVTMFYIVAHLAEDKEVAAFPSGATLQMILSMGMAVIGIFAVIFLYYTNSFLMKRRKTELGLYNVLGMGKIHIAKVLFWESFYIALFSLSMGILAGILFSKAGQLGLFKILSVETSYHFQVYGNVTAITIVLFTAIFAIIYLNGLRQIAKSSARELLAGSAVGEKEPKANFLLAFAGAILLAGGYIMAILIDNPLEAVGMFFIAVILVILGTYACFIAGSVALFKLLRKKKNYYYKSNHFISVSSMIYRMKRNGAGLASICVLSTMVLVMISSTACMYIGGDDAIDEIYPREMDMTVFADEPDFQTFDVLTEGVEDLTETICREAGIPVKNFIRYRICNVYAGLEENTLTFLPRLRAEKGLESGEELKMVYMIPAEDYNCAGGEQYRLNKNQVLVYDATGEFEDSSLEIAGSGTYQVRDILDSIDARKDSIMGVSDLYVILPDMEAIYEIYEQMEEFDKTKTNTEEEYDASMRFWYGFDTGGSLEENRWLLDELYSMTGINEDNDFPLREYFEERGVTPNYASLGFSIQSSNEAKEGFYSLYGGFFFLGILLSLTFLLAAVLIMYYKQITEGYDDKDRFAILRKVGMSDQEIRKSINSQVLTVFFAPLLLAGVHIAFAFHMISLMLTVFAITNTGLLMKVTAGAYCLFAIFYIFVYLATSKVYYRLVSEKPEK